MLVRRVSINVQVAFAPGPPGRERHKTGNEF